MKKATKLLIVLLVTLFIISAAIPIQANYQSNDGSKAVNSPAGWLENIRKMEQEGNVMGLEEQYDSTTLKPMSASNKLDVHMIKNTEWGAIALLSASQDYGKKGEGTSRYVIGGTGLKTTTGNVSGLYITQYTSWHRVAGGGSNFAKNYDDRYVDREHKDGDALLYWHEKGTTQDTWDWYGYLRGNGSIFQYCTEYNRRKSTSI